MARRRFRNGHGAAAGANAGPRGCGPDRSAARVASFLDRYLRLNRAVTAVRRDRSRAEISADLTHSKVEADALEAALQSLGGGLVERVSKHDTNPANNPQPPKRYRGM